jgi:alpha-D-ribose 1-methylphosphonate 5-triphosphate synthase subunit PhnH
LEPAFDKVFDTQKIYRQMLDAIARPGKICSMPPLDIRPPAGLSSAAAGMAFTLLDSETSFAVLPYAAAWQEYIALNTGAGNSAVDAAEFLIVEGSKNLPELAEANRGDLLSPEQGSTLIVLVDGIAESGKCARLTLSGPGIAGRIRMSVDGLHPANLERILKLNQEYPLGVDVFFVDAAGRLAAMPRSSSVHWEVAS